MWRSNYTCVHICAEEMLGHSHYTVNLPTVHIKVCSASCLHGTYSIYICFLYLFAPPLLTVVFQCEDIYVKKKISTKYNCSQRKSVGQTFELVCKIKGLAKRSESMQRFNTHQSQHNSVWYTTFSFCCLKMSPSCHPHSFNFFLGEIYKDPHAQTGLIGEFCSNLIRFYFHQSSFFCSHWPLYSVIHLSDCLTSRED